MELSIYLYRVYHYCYEISLPFVVNEWISFSESRCMSVGGSSMYDTSRVKPTSLSTMEYKQHR